ncbi:MAG TPA: hypothetical protein H9709_07365 [Candidatus Gemmiger stercoripullorum]|nr:hypothetical protein [Candidatus Gemmiger stercoripullorum]
MRNIDTIILALFFLFLVALIALDIFLFVSLMRQGDERNRLIVWKASAFTLLATAGGHVVDIVIPLAQRQPVESSNPFVQLGVMALVFFLATLYYKRKHSV